MIFETHAHYDDKAFDNDREELITKVFDSNIGYVVNVSSSLKTCMSTLDLVNKHEKIYGTIGVHPNETGELNEENFNNIVREGLNNKKIVAVGEIGLDYYWDEPDREIQKMWFERQLQLAIEKGLPICVHSREAAQDTLDIIKTSGVSSVGGVIHCFSYGKEMAKEYLSMGFYLGIGGVVTFKNAKKIKDVVDYIPLDRIVLETDSPYLAPVPYRGKRNNSTLLEYVVKEIANIKKISLEEVENITYNNAMKLYNI